MASVSGTFAAAGVSASLQLQAIGEDVTVALSGTYIAAVQLERALTPAETAWEIVFGPWVTEDATVSEVYQTRRQNETLRLRATSYTSGTVTYSASDGDKIIHERSDAFGNVIQTTRQAGVTATLVGNITGDVTGDVTGNVTGNLTGDVTGDINAVTADAEVIEAGDASLGINGLDAAQGGAIVATGGTSSTAANAGGAVSAIGGAPGATGVGGAVDITGGPGGATSGLGGAASVVAGAGVAENADGGVAALTGGGVIASTSATAGADSGAVSITTPAGALSATGVAGNSGTITIQSGVGGQLDGDSDANASGSGGNVSLIGGAGGPHDAGTTAAGGGADVILTTGDGGADVEAGDGTGGIAGDMILTVGVGGTGNTAGKDGVLVLRPGLAAVPTIPMLTNIKVPPTASGADTLTTAELLSGIYSNTPGADVAVTTPTGVLITDAIGLVADGGPLVVGDSFDFTMHNLGTTGQVITFTAGDANVTFVGFTACDPGVAAEGSGVSTWRFRYTSADAWVAYRIA